MEHGKRVLRAKDAHAWVEVWQPGSGWLTSDPTPPGDATTSTASRAAATLHRLMASNRSRWALAGALLGLGVVVALVVVLVRRRRRGRALVPEATDLWTGWTRNSGRWPPRSPGWSRRCARRVGRARQRTRSPSWPGGCRSCEPARCLPRERTLYGRRPPSAALVEEAVRDIDTAALRIRTAAEEAGASRGTRI